MFFTQSKIHSTKRLFGTFICKIIQCDQNVCFCITCWNDTDYHFSFSYLKSITEPIDSVLTHPRSSEQNMGFILDCSKLHLRKLIIKMLEDDYHDFSQVANESGLSVEEKIYEIIEYYLLIQRGRFKTYQFFTDST